jgi:hypothetical protein
MSIRGTCILTYKSGMLEEEFKVGLETFPNLKIPSLLD